MHTYCKKKICNMHTCCKKKKTVLCVRKIDALCGCTHWFLRARVMLESMWSTTYLGGSLSLREQECGNSAAVTVRKTVTKAVTAPCSKNFQGNSSSDTVPQRRSGCRDCNLSWDDLMRRLLKSFRGALMDPFTGKVDIMKGDRDSCVNEVILVDVDLHLL